MAESQILALSGKSRGVLRLEYGEELAFSLVSPAYLKDAELWLIFSDGEYQVLEGCQGRCPLPPRRVRAAAVARQGTFLMTGGHADFGAARSACFTRHEKKRLKALEVQAQPRSFAAAEERPAAGKPRQQSEEAQGREEKRERAQKEQRGPGEKKQPPKAATNGPEQVQELRQEKSPSSHPGAAQPETVQAEKVPGQSGQRAARRAEEQGEREGRGQEVPSKLGTAAPPSAKRALFPALEEQWESSAPNPEKGQKKSPEPLRACMARFEKRTTPVFPFPKIFPSSKWVRIEYPDFPGRGHYLTGEILQASGESARALAVPGRYGLNPPAWLKGFESYLEGADGQGYWLLFQDAGGQPLSIAQVLGRAREGCGHSS